jgi:hypothetical protein
MDSASRVIFQVQQVRPFAPATRSRRESLLLVLIAGLFAFLAVALAVSRAADRSRLALYRADSLCQAPLTSPLAREGSVCSVELTRVVDRRYSTGKSSSYFGLALRAPDGGIDTVELKGDARRLLWSTTPLGASVLVQHFREPGQSRPHVTVVRNYRTVARTAWNPAWHADSTIAGITFLGIIAGVALIVAWRKRNSLE